MSLLSLDEKCGTVKKEMGKKAENCNKNVGRGSKDKQHYIFNSASLIDSGLELHYIPLQTVNFINHNQLHALWKLNVLLVQITIPSLYSSLIVVTVVAS